MRRLVVWCAAAMVLGVLGAAVAAGLDETTVVAHLTAADHEVDEGYFSIGDGTTVIARPGSDLHRWLTAHRGQKVRLVVETTRDGATDDPTLRPGLGRETGQVSRRQ